jgi:pyruvate/2-oxoglutarate dehydrogenase complex dihydrolipoamide dehydrogenase (E3) component
VIIGSGAGGKLIAWTFASKGQRVAMIERKYVGGSCPNIACLPSKNVIHTAQVASYVRRSEEFGIARDGFKLDMFAVRERKRKMVSSLIETHLAAYKDSGTELMMGFGRFTGPRTVEVMLDGGSKRQLRGTNVVINTGTHAAIDSTPGLAEAQPLTHIEALELDEVPEHLVVIGGGYVGVELAQATRRFGSPVTIIDRNGWLLHREDDDVTEAIGGLFQDEGIELLLNARIKKVSGVKGAVVGNH